MVCVHSPIAQLVERAAVNRVVVGSSPTGRAGNIKIIFHIYAVCPGGEGAVLNAVG